MDDAAMYGRYGHMADGTHKTVEDDLITDAVMVTKPCTAEDYPSVKELHSGCDIRRRSRRRRKRRFLLVVEAELSPRLEHALLAHVEVSVIATNHARLLRYRCTSP